MIDLDGVQLAGGLWESGEYNDMKMVLVSARLDGKTDDVARAANFDAYVTKSMDPSTLNETVEQAVFV